MTAFQFASRYPETVISRFELLMIAYHSISRREPCFFIIWLPIVNLQYQT
jgi:hypothetical protein